MKNVLIIANQFPPMGGSGVQRTSKFVKYLPDFGYNPIVLTRDSENLALKDATLMNDIAAETVVIRTKSYDYTNLKRIFRIPGKVYSRHVLIPDAERIWAAKSYNAAVSAIKKYNIKLIYSTSYPYSDHLLAMRLKREFPDLKWTADFRDEWTNNPYTLDRPYGKRRTKIEKQMEQSVLNKADALISNTPVMVKNFVEINNLDGGNFYCIPNGYDIDDFKNIEPKTEKNSKFTLTYTGALYGRRKPDTFFEALKQLIDEGSVKKDELQIRFIGNYILEKLNADVERFKLKGTVEIISYMPHTDCLKALAKSDCLLLIEGSGKGANAFYTGKIFEYMMSKAPVLAIIPKDGAAAGLVQSTNIGKVADFENIDEIKSNFMLYYKMWKNGDKSYSPKMDEIAKFERRKLTQSLSKIFDKLIERNRS